MKNVVSEPEFQSLPGWRFLYESADDLRYVVVSRGCGKGLWVVEDGWTTNQSAAGPFRPYDALRAFFLANMRVPQGCRLGTWQSGIELFQLSSLPGHADDWSVVDPSWLDPSVSVYRESDIDFDEPETLGCCEVSHDRPWIDWETVSERVRSEMRQLVDLRLPATHDKVGVLREEWNAHAVGSPVVARSTELWGDFAVVDLPPLPR